MCLALPEVVEASSHGHPVFLVGTKMFCAFEMHRKRPSIAVRIPTADLEEQMEASGMFATPYGRGAWTSIWVAGGHAKKGATATPWNTAGVPATNGVEREIDWKELATLVQIAYDGVARKRRR